ncbi:MAG: tripartite tricarboxylate transporter substrate binding protein [Gammaproteobacteria bacterium]|nr:tripartite tricarboxylate transporter substrate binding protein [Gammaproteobacteria bacterium]MBU1441596.1 tripartite tricarboxylate transporter substrate binding protein [Gammaproteobacteria bacterium]MBU2286122.1 tripartite tricarboxylate transporter substrate binding protein [Gammaproteobacteria bacterium]
MTNEMTRRAMLSAVALAAATTVLAWPAGAAETDGRPVRIIVPYPPGGGTDILGRVLAKQLTGLIDQPVIVDNKAGAAGLLGATYVARAEADGLTLLLGNSATNAIAPALYPKLQYDPAKDFVPVAQIATVGNAIAVGPSVPVKNIAELVAWSKHAQNGGSYGSWGVGSGGHLAMEMIKSWSGTKMVHIPYKGSALSLNDLMGGQLPVAVVDVTVVAPFYKAGKVRVIGVTGTKRSPNLPDVPTLAEQGVPFNTDSWYAVFAPAQTPAPMLEKLRTAFAKVIKEPEVSKTLIDLGMNPSTINAEEFAAVQRKDSATWARLVKESGATAE